jgi:ribosomal protein S15P/S13E
MAGKKSNKGKGSYATYAAENRALVNKKRKVAKHLAAHPNDVQTKNKVNYVQRKAPRVAGNFKPQKHYWYDAAGHKILMPSFAPAITTRVGK